MIFLFWFFLLFSNCKLDSPNSISFITQFKKGVQLDIPEKKYLKNNNIFYALNNKTHKKDENKDSQKEWYYVHFLSQNISDIFNQLKVKRKNGIIKNAFTLFLSKKQLEQISNIALVKKINPEDKYFYEDNFIIK